MLFRNIALMYKNNKVFTDFFIFHEIDGRKILKHSISIKSKSSGSDAIQIGFVKLFCPFLLPFITHIENECLQNSTVLNVWKIAYFKPIEWWLTLNHLKI